MKKLIYSMGILAMLASCQKDPITPVNQNGNTTQNGGGNSTSTTTPCGNWWDNYSLPAGATYTDTDGDSIPDIVTYTDSLQVTYTILTNCPDLDTNCVPDCLEFLLIPGNGNNGNGNGNGNGGNNNGPCSNWWANFILPPGSSFVDIDGDSIPDEVILVDSIGGTSTIDLSCPDLDGDCIPDCLTSALCPTNPNGNGNGGNNNGPCANWHVGLNFMSGVVLIDSDNDGAYDLFNVVDSTAGNVMTYMFPCGDINNDCVPDCIEPYIIP